METNLWKERYRILFDRNIAGTILTNVEGRILDCNEPCAHIFGFDSREDMLAHSAWDFYFDRAERESVIDHLRLRRNWPAEEVCLRDKNGAPVWLLATRTVADTVQGRPELLLGTVIDITPQKKAQASLGSIKGSKDDPARHENSEITKLCERLAILFQRASQVLQPVNLYRIERQEIQELSRVLEEMKMLVAEVEVARLFLK